MNWHRETLTGFGRSTASASNVCDAQTESDLRAIVAECRNETRLARGAGLSYGDTAQLASGRVIRTTGLQAVHSFDPVSGEIVVGPGVTFGQLMNEFSASGWIPPVTPGTQFATVGGAVANDVHGKNHDADGSFGDHVLWFDLLLPSGEARRVDASSDPSLFAATIGGIGLTGVIARLCFRMRQVPGTRVLVEERRIRNIHHYLDVLAQVREGYRHTVGWIDGIARGRNLGRGVLEAANEIHGVRKPDSRRRVRVPFDFPARSINAFTVGLFNSLYYRRISDRGRIRAIDMESFFYPLDTLLDWNRMYGRPGFLQFQSVVADSESRRALPSLLESISRSGTASFLAVIKTLGGEGKGYLSFPKRGVTLALDLQNRPGIDRLLNELHDITLTHGGRVYLAKDSRMTSEHFRRMYPRLDEFRAVLDRVDPGRLMCSDMALRLGI